MPWPSRARHSPLFRQTSLEPWQSPPPEVQGSEVAYTQEVLSSLALDPCNGGHWKLFPCGMAQVWHQILLARRSLGSLPRLRGAQVAESEVSCSPAEGW